MVWTTWLSLALVSLISIGFGWQHPIGLLVVSLGTFLGVLQSFSWPLLHACWRQTGEAATEACNTDRVSEWLLAIQEQARREGVLSLEHNISRVPYPLFRKGLAYLVDHRPSDWIRHQLTQASDHRITQLLQAAHVWESAAGLAPTMGILGALASLMMNGGHLKTGDVAPAFTATFLGVGLANLVSLPMAHQLRQYAERQQAMDRMWIDGLISIQAGEHRMVLLDRLHPEREMAGLLNQ